MFNLRKRIAAAIEWRIEERLAPMRHELDRVQDEVHELERGRRELHDVRDTAGDLRRDLDRLIPQIAALETRLADVDERGRVAGDAQRFDATREHERVRIKLQAVSHYEERLRRLESAVDRAESR